MMTDTERMKLELALDPNYLKKQLEYKLRNIFDENNDLDARNKIGKLVGTLNNEMQRELNTICSKIFEEKGKKDLSHEARDYYLCAIRCALINNDRNRAYEILDDDRALNFMKEIANEGISPSGIYHPIDIVLDLMTPRNPEYKVIDSLLIDYLTARGKRQADHMKPNREATLDYRLSSMPGVIEIKKH